MRKAAPGKRTIAAAVAVAALVGGGAAVAATQLSGGERSKAIIDSAAQELGVTPEKLSEALEKATAAEIDKALVAGEITQEQADALKQRVESGEAPLVGVPMHRGRGGHDRGPGHGHGRGHHRGHVRGLDAAATYLGLTDDELRAELMGGTTLAALAAEKGKTVDGLRQAMLDDAKTRLAAKVAAGEITQAQADQITPTLEQRIDAVVNGELPPRGPRGFRGDVPTPDDGTAPAPSTIPTETAPATAADL